MKFFTHKALRSSDTFAAARTAYWDRIYSIRADLPPRLFDLISRNSLHDAKLLSFATVKSTSDLFIVLDGCRNGPWADTDRVSFVLHFINASFSKRSIDRFVGEDLLYVEVSQGTKKPWTFSALTTKSSGTDIFSTQFEDFGFYSHDSRMAP
jgi:hypothetical protein